MTGQTEPTEAVGHNDPDKSFFFIRSKNALLWIVIVPLGRLSRTTVTGFECVYPKERSEKSSLVPHEEIYFPLNRRFG
jgi:hypothetical protein